MEVERAEEGEEGHHHLDWSQYYCQLETLLELEGEAGSIRR